LVLWSKDQEFAEDGLENEETTTSWEDEENVDEELVIKFKKSLSIKKKELAEAKKEANSSKHYSYVYAASKDRFSQVKQRRPRQINTYIYGKAVYASTEKIEPVKREPLIKVEQFLEQLTQLQSQLEYNLSNNLYGAESNNNNVAPQNDTKEASSTATEFIQRVHEGEILLHDKPLRKIPSLQYLVVRCFTQNLFLFDVDSVRQYVPLHVRARIFLSLVKQGKI
jgi:hypothetical protein